MNETSIKLFSDSQPDVLHKELLAILAELTSIKNKTIADTTALLENYLSFFSGQQPVLSAINLAHYLSVRQSDLKSLQKRLEHLGFSSLHHNETNILDTLNHIIEILSRAVGHTESNDIKPEASLTPEKSKDLLTDRCTELFGPLPANRKTYIMVTLPSEAAWNLSLVESLITKGMNCARIDCALDDVYHWQAIINNVRQAEKKLKTSCKIFMDLAGWNICTGAVKKGPAIKHIKVSRNVYGRLIEPTDILLEEENSLCTNKAHTGSITKYNYRLKLPRSLHTQIAIGDRLRLTDIRGKKRDITIVGQRSAKQWVAQCTQSIYISPETKITWQRKNKKDKFHTLGEFCPSPFDGEPDEIRLFEGDPLLLSASQNPGSSARFDENGIIVAPARISCNPPQALKNLKPGEPVWIDSGKLGCIVESRSDEGALLVVNHANPKGTVLKEGKGINFPHSAINLPSLTSKDIEDLVFIAKNADIVGISNVDKLNTIDRVLKVLNKHKAIATPIIVKIDTTEAIKKLPQIILGTIGRATLGVMVTQDELAVGVVGERFAEIQQEILSACKASHVPVVWATQKLHAMANDGATPHPGSRDAAMTQKTECVMLYKGPYIERALQALDKIICCTASRQHKKQSYIWEML